MFTSRAEYRLQLRASNADQRLLKYSADLSLLDNNLLKDLDKKNKKYFKRRKGKAYVCFTGNNWSGTKNTGH